MADALKYIIGFTIAVLAYLWDQHVKSNNEVTSRVNGLEDQLTDIQVELRGIHVKLIEIRKDLKDLERGN